VPPPKNLHSNYEHLVGFLKAITFRLQLLAALEFFLLLPAGFFLVLLGGFFALEVRDAFPYLPFFYSLLAIISLFAILIMGLWRIARKPSLDQVGRGVEEIFPRLRDDVTNSLLLYQQMQKKGSGDISGAFIGAQIQRTVNEVSVIQGSQVVDFKKSFRHLRILLPVILAFCGVLAFAPQFLDRSLALITNPLAALPVPETIIFVEPGEKVLPRGTPVMIKAWGKGKMPDRLMLAVWPEGREAGRLTMKPEGEGKFSYRIASVQFSFRYQVYNGRAVSPLYSIQVVDPPDVAKIKLLLIPPDYTGLAKEAKEDGHIEALKGTVVNLEAQATKRVREGKIFLNQGGQLPLEVNEDRLKGSLLVFYPGTYSVKVQDELGFENPNPVQYQIRLLPDKYPEGEIVSPAQDLEVTGSEVFPIVYAARDDFGLTTVRLSYELGGRERSINLKVGTSTRSLGPETFKWDLATLGLSGGDQVAYRLEVWDNDLISGPKVNYSRTFHFSVLDERARAAKEGEEAQRIADDLLDLLGDQLEAKTDRDTLTRGMEEILNRVDRNLKEMGNRAERFDLEALRRNLASLKERLPTETPETVTQEMERLALLAEDIAKKARMHEVEALAREIKNRQKRLLDSLNDLKGSLSREGLESVLKELKNLENLIRSIMEALGKLATALPDEFINSPELQGMDFQDLFKDLEVIRDRLKAGDISGALEAAQRLLQALSEMMASLGKAGARAGMAPLNRLQGEMNRQSGELDKILAEQREILQETEKIDREIKRMAEEEKAARLKRTLPQFQETLEQLDRSLPPEQKDSIEELRRLLQGGLLERFSEAARDLEKELSGKSEDQKLIRELRKMAEGWRPEPRELTNPENRSRFSDLSSRQGSLRDRTKGLQEKLEMLAQLFPGMDTEILKDLKASAESMGEATGKLKGEDAPGAIPPEEEAIRRLSQSQQAMQQMSQQMAMRMQAARWGYPWGYDPRPGWYYGPWIPMPTLPQPEVNRPRERGYTGIDREEFEPPSKDAYQVPKIFREQVMEGLKEEIPSQYKKKVEKYFKGLTE